MEGVAVNPGFWRGKRVFLTGHTGFKGSWLSIWLSMMGASVKGYALSPPSTPSLFEEANVGSLIASEIGDIRDLNALTRSVNEFSPEIVFHMAAQPLVRLSYHEPVETYATNVMGTVNLLEAVRQTSAIKVIVNITTDKCYENREWVWGYREDEPMGGYDPYSSSKACSELVTAAYRRSYFKEMGTGIATARAGNVIGGGDWAADRLVPDILRSFGKSQPVVIRNPESIRPWQHVLEPLSGYLLLAEQLWERPNDYSEAWNFGPTDEDAKPVRWIVERMASRWGSDAQWSVDNRSQPHEARYLKLDISKARQSLGWNPRWDLDHALTRVIDWHQAWAAGKDVAVTSREQIESYLLAD
jgi:CDP-glucose 4,6-dehydratase